MILFRVLGFLVNLLKPLMKVGSPLMKNVLKPLTKSIVIPLGLISAAAVVDARIPKKLSVWEKQHWSFQWGNISIKKIVKFLEDSVLLMCYLNNWKWNEKTIGGFFGIFLACLGTRISENMLLSKGVIRVGDKVIWAGDGVIRAGTETVKDFARVGTKIQDL